VLTSTKMCIYNFAAQPYRFLYQKLKIKDTIIIKTNEYKATHLTVDYANCNDCLLMSSHFGFEKQKSKYWCTRALGWGTIFFKGGNSEDLYGEMTN